MVDRILMPAEERVFGQRRAGRRNAIFGDLEPERRAPQQLGEERVDGGVGNELLPDARVVKRFDLYREGAQMGTVPDRLARAGIDDAPSDENVNIPMPKTANHALIEHVEEVDKT